MGLREKVRAGVVGVGYVGRFHAEKYASHHDAVLVGVADIDGERARKVAAPLGVRVFSDHRELFGCVDCVSIAVPAHWHFPIARDFLEHDVDVLVEKPLASTVEEGKILTKLAASRQRILQVGHLERFNPAVRALQEVVTAPRFIEAQRVSPFPERGTDVDVVRDLMIHDLDVILSLVRVPVRSVEAFGVPVLTAEADMAKVRLRFADGCIADLTASRVALKRERKIRIFQPDMYIVVDFDEQHLRICRREHTSEGRGPSLAVQECPMTEQDLLAEEIRTFLQAVRERTEPVVGGQDGVRALEVAHAILEHLRGAG